MPFPLHSMFQVVTAFGRVVSIEGLYLYTWITKRQLRLGTPGYVHKYWNVWRVWFYTSIWNYTGNSTTPSLAEGVMIELVLSFVSVLFFLKTSLHIQYLTQKKRPMKFVNPYCWRLYHENRPVWVSDLIPYEFLIQYIQTCKTVGKNHSPYKKTNW